jgi:glucans biosynthesis protein
MKHPVSRRQFTKTAGAALALAAMPRFARAWDLASVGATQSFDYAWLKGHARFLSGQPHVATSTQVPAAIKALNWDQHQSIRYRSAQALWRKQNLKFRAQFFHLGMYQQTPVHIFEVIDGKAVQIAYDKALFDYGKSGLDPNKLPADLGFAGVQIVSDADWTRDVAAFLGASYFRAVGSSFQYGLSARGLAIDCGLPRPEEFPVFTAFFLERPAPGSASFTVYALLESESITGAYKFVITPGQNTVMDVETALYPRKPIERLGIAPLTSMYQCGENDRRMANDFRPEIHDSDGLAMWNGSGEWIWRPINNPRQLRFNAYFDRAPRGFGLLQRDRNFDHYQDDGVFYDKRPSLWVEPRSDWGEGSVQLVEIPTVDETFDNVVAFWNPKEPCKPGEERLFSYRLHWGAQPPVAPPLGYVIATRTGLGGVVGQKRTRYSRRFAIDFAGGNLAGLPKGAKVEPVIEVSRGNVKVPSARPLHPINGYRAIFDLEPLDESPEPVNLRLYLRGADGKPLTETWMYQWSLPPVGKRGLW